MTKASGPAAFLPHALAAAFAVFWTVLAIDPVMRDVWWAENIPVIAAFCSWPGHSLCSAFPTPPTCSWAAGCVLHTIGGHYTFANVPFDFFTDLFGAERNHFDRLGHYSIGFYAFPVAELLTRKGLAKPLVVYLFGLFSIMALAAGYEIIEWWYAALEGGDAGVEFLGSQGDIWDAQKDMLADTLGAVTALISLPFPPRFSRPACLTQLFEERLQPFGRHGRHKFCI